MNISRPSSFALRLRIPAWSTSRISVNGKPTPVHIQKGFAILDRKWQDGDRIDLDLSLPMRLEAINKQHPGTVALVRGPLVLFALGDSPTVTRQQLLAAKRIPQQNTWTTETASGTLHLRPFTEIHDERYNTYLKIT